MSSSSLPNNSRSNLCPGYKQVDSFGPAEDYEDEEEVTYVTLDLGNIEPTLVPSSSTYRLIGLDTPTPFLQLSGTILKGRHEPLLGTELLFTDDQSEHDWGKRGVTHVANTEQRICFNEVQLQPRASSEPTPIEEDGMEGVSANHAQEMAVDAEGSTPVSVVDRVTGKDVPKVVRRRRKGKGREKAKGTNQALDEGTSQRAGREPGDTTVDMEQ